MATQIILNAEERKEIGGAKKIITLGYIPAVIYGPGAANQNIKVKKVEFEKVFHKAGESNLVDLIVDEKPLIKVLIKDLQKNPVKGIFSHVDFYQVDMKKKITTNIPLNFIGDSKVVKESGATLIKNFDEVEVECLPEDLVDHIDVDLAALINFEDAIRIKDLKVSAGIKIMRDAEDIIILAAEAQKEEVAPVVAVPVVEAAAGATPAAGEAKSGDAKAPAAGAPKEKGKEKK
jgi:large subunit ribosomal protein L25